MSSNFRKNYPDFASIEYQIRQAHAERSIYIANAIASGIAKLLTATGRLFAKPASPKADTVRA